MIKTKKQMFLVIGIFGLFMLIAEVSYAFFNYTRTGGVNTINVGRISFNTNQTSSITLNNAFPITVTKDSNGHITNETGFGTMEITVVGDTDYNEGVEYLVSSTNTNIYTSNGKLVPLSLDIIPTNLGTENANYFTARESKNATIYKKIIGDTLYGDGMLLVGYIKPNTTKGTIEGINGKITIKAYLDDTKILITDTYDGTESDINGTLNSLAQGKTILTTSEWSSLSNSGISFKIKVEANKGIWVNESLEEIMKNDAIMDNISSEFVSASTGINFGAVSSDTNGKGIYVRSGTENDQHPIIYYRGAVDNNNVIFDNKCWKIVRTTATGGIKLVYNGIPNINNECNNSGVDTQITVSDTNTFAYSGGGLYRSLAYNGYMWGDVYEWTNAAPSSGSYFGNDVEYSDGVYHLVDAKVGYDGTHHYSCDLTSGSGTCSSVRYYYYTDYYITLTNGNKIEDAILKMQENINNSNAKTQIDNWYASNMNSVTNKLEDTVWCNDRSISSKAGWDPNGNVTEDILYHSTYDRIHNTHIPSLTCSNKNDSFTVNSDAGNKKLIYPVALLTSDEIVLAGGGEGSFSSFYLNSGSNYWTFSPNRFDYGISYEFSTNISGSLGHDYSMNTYGLRPAISIKPGLFISSGDGTGSNPYKIR